MPNAGRKQTFHPLRKLMNESALQCGKNNTGNNYRQKGYYSSSDTGKGEGKQSITNYSFGQLTPLRVLFYGNV